MPVLQLPRYRLAACSAAATVSVVLIGLPSRCPSAATATSIFVSGQQDQHHGERDARHDHNDRTNLDDYEVHVPLAAIPLGVKIGFSLDVLGFDLDDKTGALPWMARRGWLAVGDMLLAMEGQDVSNLNPREFAAAMSEVVQSKREKNSRRSTEGAEKHGDSRRERPPRSSSSLAFSEEEPYITLRVRPGKQPGQSSDLMMHSMYSPPTVEEASEELASWCIRYSNGPLSDDRVAVTVSAFGGEPDDCEARPVVEAQPCDACSSLQNVPEVVGAHVLVCRGGCDFLAKARTVSSAGGFSAIIVDDGPGGLRMEAEPGERVEIPVVMISKLDGNVLRDAARSTSRALDQMSAMLIITPACLPDITGSHPQLMPPDPRINTSRGSAVNPNTDNPPSKGGVVDSLGANGSRALDVARSSSVVDSSLGRTSSSPGWAKYSTERNALPVEGTPDSPVDTAGSVVGEKANADEATADNEYRTTVTPRKPDRDRDKKSEEINVGASGNGVDEDELFKGGDGEGSDRRCRESVKGPPRGGSLILESAFGLPFSAEFLSTLVPGSLLADAGIGPSGSRWDSGHGVAIVVGCDHGAMTDETESSPPQESGAILLFPPATDPPDSGSRCPVEEQLLLSHNLNAAISVIVADAEHAATLGSLATTLTATAVKLKTRISEPVAGVAREGKGELTSSGGGGVNFFTGKDAILRSTAGSNGGRLSPDAIEVNVDAASGAGVGEGDVGGLENIRGLKPLTSLSPPRPPPSSHTTAENVQSSSSSSRSSSSDANNLDMKGNVADNDCPPVVIVVGHQDGKDMLSWIQGFAPTTSNVGKSLADGGVGRFGKNEPTGGENIVGAGVIIARLVEQEDVPRLWEDVAWASDARNWPTGSKQRKRIFNRLRKTHSPYHRGESGGGSDEAGIRTTSSATRWALLQRAYAALDDCPPDIDLPPSGEAPDSGSSSSCTSGDSEF